MFIVLLAPWMVKPSPWYINLKDYPLYIKQGFQQNDINRNPVKTAWDMVLPPQSRESATVKTLLPLVKQRRFLSPIPDKSAAYTFFIPFTLDKQWIDLFRQEPPILLGLFMATIGDNWEIYLNGTLVYAQVYIDSEGYIREHRAWRSLTVPLRYDLFREGENYLGFRIIGSPFSENTGFYYQSPYYIDEYQKVRDHARNQATLVCAAVYVFTGLYHLLLFVMRRNARYNLYYSLFSIAVSIYLLSRNPFIYTLFKNSQITYRIEYVSMYWVLCFMAAFFEEFNNRHITLLTKLWAIFTIPLSLTTCLFSQGYADDLLYLWQWLSIPMTIYIMSYGVILPFIKRVQNIKNAHYSGIPGALRKSIAHDLLQTSQGNILIIIFICFLIMLYDLLVTILFSGSSLLSQYSFFLFNLASALILAKHLASTFNQMNDLNEILEATVRERTKALEEQVQIAETANRAKSDFMATISHEIRTPLNAIIGLSDIELRKNLNEDTGNAIKKIRSSGSILLGIINDILDISKIETGSFEIIPVEYDTADLLSDAVRLNIVRIGDKPITFVFEVEENLPEHCIGDELRIKQILNNLLSNAIKYTKKGTVRFQVFLEKPNRLVCCVQDTGIGIRQEDMGRLFTEYSQLDTRANRKIEGTGLGLAITKRLLDLMGGSVQVESEYGKGSTFTVRIPQEISDSKIIGKEKSDKLKALEFFETEQPSESLIPIISHKPISILAVDDVEINLEIVQGLMEPYGFTVDCVLSGKEAIERIKAGTPRYDMVLMDHMMPEMDGIEAVRIIRQEIDSDYARNIAIIALTANALAGNEEMFLEHGFNGFISKPIDIMRLNEMLKKWT